MASETLTIQEADEQLADERRRSISAGSHLVKLLLPLASLKLTVALFFLAIVLILAGTLAQVDKDIWDVMNQYFRTWFAWIDFQVFFPKSFFAGEAPEIPGGIWFPGGFFLGAAMGVNLLAAHALRFKVQARGPRLMAGLAVIALGAVLTWIVIVGGSGKDTIEGAASFEWSSLWTVLKGCLVALWLAVGYALVTLDRARRLERIGLTIVVIALGAVIVYVLARPDQASLADPSMRILWQLIKGGLAGLVLLAGCALVFRKRAGIVLLHAGVALVMSNELVVYNLHSEGQMHIQEGETVNYVQDIRTVELAVIDPSDTETDDVVVVPRGRLLADKTIQDAALPFDVEVVKYLQNSSLKRVVPSEKNEATAGAGLQWTAQERRPGSGTDMGGKVDVAAAYVKLLKKDTDEPIGTYLVSLELNPQKVQVGDKTYDLSLRFKRTYKPYSMKLYDVRFDKYLGTQTAKNYSSDVRLVDSGRNVDRDVHIWMNNPLRFAGETFYQSSYDIDNRGQESTTLQVVTNTGWMIPYVACMLVATGMLAQFSITLVRFLRRRDEEDAVPTDQPRRPARGTQRVVDASDSTSRASLILTAIVVLGAGAWVLHSAREPGVPAEKMQLTEFGKLPLVYEGRVKPFDTLARNTLRVISDKQTFTDETGEIPQASQPAIKWLLDVVTGSPDAFKHKVFRITNLEVLQTLGLERRHGYRFALEEFRDKVEEFERQAELASSVEPSKLSVYQKKILELDKKIRLLTLLMAAFEQPRISQESGEQAMQDLQAAIKRHNALQRMQPPLVVPPEGAESQWDPYSVAWTKSYARANMMGQDPNPAVINLNNMFVAYRKGDATAFNSELVKYETLLTDKKPQDVNATKVNFEAFFNRFEPFYRAMVLYVVAFVLVALGWLGWSRPLNRAAFWLVVLTFAVHTFAIVARIYISGRPPVTNLYSTAVFIGWAAVLFGIVIEVIYKLGIGTVVAAVGGFATLVIAHNLASGGDTFIVLQAVLDTQFWLATHVVCETLGYSTTLVAGFLGLLYIVRGVLTPSLSPATAKDLGRMIYGTLCFAIFFSFVGTVLGGLWADDSWGRFWGWDPKENGALIIVLWNALVLHARWGGMVKDRGLAALAVVGNIVTSWSWFGVNELGIGLHSYGFTEGVLLALGIFIATQLAAIALAALPRELWWSSRAASA